MDCYLIHIPPNLSYQDISMFNINIQEKMDCINCFVAKLEKWQVEELMNLGCDVEPDSHCSL